jgi:hypothetical protein
MRSGGLDNATQKKAAEWTASELPTSNAKPRPIRRGIDRRPT